MLAPSITPHSAEGFRGARANPWDVRRRTGTVLVAAAAVLWGSIGIAVRSIDAAGIGALEASAWRAGLAFCGLFTVGLLSGRIPLRVASQDLGLFAVYGFVSVALFFVLYFDAIRRTSMATAAILLYTAPTWVALLSCFVLGESLSRSKLVALVLAFCGCGLVVRAYDPEALRLNLVGILLGLGSGFTYGLYSIFGKLALRRYEPGTVLLYALGFGTLFLVALGLLAGLSPARFAPGHVLRAGGAILYLGLVATLLPHWLYIAGLRSLEASRATVVATLEPVVAAVLGYALLGERLDPPQLLGGLLVLASIRLVQVER
jgi:DME family drug/metabolite transporter